MKTYVPNFLKFTCTNIKKYNGGPYFYTFFSAWDQNMEYYLEFSPGDCVGFFDFWFPLSVIVKNLDYWYSMGCDYSPEFYDTYLERNIKTLVRKTVKTK